MKKIEKIQKNRKNAPWVSFGKRIQVQKLLLTLANFFKIEAIHFFREIFWNVDRLGSECMLSFSKGKYGNMGGALVGCPPVWRLWYKCFGGSRAA